jgi:two-component system, NtrC family, nitrogen regulation sensor histidine kinase NtrY
VGPAAAAAIMALAPGTRRIVTLADGGQMLVSVSRFKAFGRPSERLITIQRIAGELDAVELKARQDMVQVLAHEMMNSLTPISSLSESLQQLFHRSDEQASSENNEEIAGALDAITRRSRVFLLMPCAR